MAIPLNKTNYLILIQDLWAPSLRRVPKRGGVFCFYEQRDSNKEGAKAEENSPGDCFRRRGNERKRGDRRICAGKTLNSPPRKKPLLSTKTREVFLMLNSPRQPEWLSGAFLCSFENS